VAAFLFLYQTRWQLPSRGFFEFSSKFRNNSYRIFIVAKRFGIGLIVFAAWLISVDNLMYVLCSRCRSLNRMTVILWQADVRDAMLAWPCVCLSVSVCHKSVFYWNGWANPAGLWHGGFRRSILQCVIRKFRYLQKFGYFPLEWNFAPNYGLWKFCHGISIIKASYQLSWRKVDA